MVASLMTPYGKFRPYYKFTAESVGERVLKTDERLTELRARVYNVAF